MTSTNVPALSALSVPAPSLRASVVRPARPGYGSSGPRRERGGDPERSAAAGVVRMRAELADDLRAFFRLERG